MAKNKKTIVKQAINKVVKETPTHEKAESLSVEKKEGKNDNEMDSFSNKYKNLKK